MMPFIANVFIGERLAGTMGICGSLAYSREKA
jgi:hypothetical protein